MYQHPRIAFQLADRKIANLKSSQTTKQQFTFFFIEHKDRLLIGANTSS